MQQDKPFTFICNKGWRGTEWDRGGVAFLLQGFSSEFSKSEKVQLIIKLNPAYINPQIIKQCIDNLNLPEDRAPINVNCSILSPKQLNELYNSADCFVCATRAEAFNLPGLEAMSCRLPTIQTRFGGQTDYMTDKNSLFIDYELSESEEKPMYEGISWATPKIESIRKQLRWAFENQDKIKEMGKQAEEDSKNFTWDNSANLIYKFI
jgi:glycosyltransferase involved in cell wall biosynthesis